MGKHRKKVPVLRRLARYGFTFSAVLVLLIAYFSQPVAVSTSAEIPRTPPIDSSTLNSQSTTKTSPPAKTKITKSRRAAQLASPKIEKDQLVTSPSSRSIKPVERTAASSPQDHVTSTTPRAAPRTKITKSLVVQQRAIPQSTIPKQNQTLDSPKPKISKITTTPRVVPSTIIRTTQIPLPTTENAPPVPILTSNSKCASIGLLPVAKAACNQILAAFPEVKSVLGVGSRAGNPNSCHPKGLALDLIVGANKALGDRLYAYVIARRSSLGATPVVLWQVPDHFDHVHISFDPCKG